MSAKIVPVNGRGSDDPVMEPDRSVTVPETYFDAPVVGHHDDLVVACRWGDADSETWREAEAVLYLRKIGARLIEPSSKRTFMPLVTALIGTL